MKSEFRADIDSIATKRTAQRANKDDKEHNSFKAKGEKK